MKSGSGELTHHMQFLTGNCSKSEGLECGNPVRERRGDSVRNKFFIENQRPIIKTYRFG